MINDLWKHLYDSQLSMQKLPYVTHVGGSFRASQTIQIELIYEAE